MSGDRTNPLVAFARSRFILVLGAVLIVLAAVGYLRDWGAWLFPPEQDITLDFNLIGNCDAGHLGALRRDGYLSADLDLENGAAELAICDQEPLTAPPSGLAAGIAETYAGCLVFDGAADRVQLVRDSLTLLGNPDAVCRLRTESGLRYLCRGTVGAGRAAPSAATATDPADLPACPDRLDCWLHPDSCG